VSTFFCTLTPAKIENPGEANGASGSGNPGRYGTRYLQPGGPALNTGPGKTAK